MKKDGNGLGLSSGGKVGSTDGREWLEAGLRLVPGRYRSLIFLPKMLACLLALVQRRAACALINQTPKTTNKTNRTKQENLLVHGPEKEMMM